MEKDNDIRDFSHFFNSAAGDKVDNLDVGIFRNDGRFIILPFDQLVINFDHQHTEGVVHDL